MDFLSVNETKSYSTNILNTELVRTGTNSSGSCFFYALLLPFKQFRSLGEEERLEYITNKRGTLAEKIQMEEWFLIQNGNVAFLQIIQTMGLMIHTIPSVLKENQDYFKKYDIDGTALEILFTLLNPSLIEKEILPQWDLDCTKNSSSALFLEDIKNNWYQLYKSKILKAIDDLEKKVDPHIKKMDHEKKAQVVQKLAMLSYPIFDFVTQHALKEFKTEISDPQKWLNVFTFTSVMDYMDMKVNIIIIDSTTGMPYEGMKLFYNKEDFDNENPYAVILYFKDMHFESLGKKQNLPNNKYVINRLFKKDDPFIITCMTYLGQEDDELENN